PRAERGRRDLRLAVSLARVARLTPFVRFTSLAGRDSGPRSRRAEEGSMGEGRRKRASAPAKPRRMPRPPEPPEPPDSSDSPESREPPIPLTALDLLAGLAPGVELHADDLPAGVDPEDQLAVAEAATMTVADAGKMLRCGETAIRRLIRGAVLRPVATGEGT